MTFKKVTKPNHSLANCHKNSIESAEEEKPEIVLLFIFNKEQLNALHCSGISQV